jgi:hypothetical protein
VRCAEAAREDRRAAARGRPAQRGWSRTLGDEQLSVKTRSTERSSTWRGAARNGAKGAEGCATTQWTATKLAHHVATRGCNRRLGTRFEGPARAAIVTHTVLEFCRNGAWRQSCRVVL